MPCETAIYVFIYRSMIQPAQNHVPAPQGDSSRKAQGPKASTAKKTLHTQRGVRLSSRKRLQTESVEVGSGAKW